jgi:hypothetical protein
VVLGRYQAPGTRGAWGMQSLGLSRRCLGCIQGHAAEAARRRGEALPRFCYLCIPVHGRRRRRKPRYPTRTLSLAALVFAVGVTGLQGSRVEPALGHRAALELSLTWTCSPRVAGRQHTSLLSSQSAHHSTTHHSTRRDAHAHAHDRYDPRCNGCAQPQLCGAHRLPVVHGLGHGDMGRRRL